MTLADHLKTGETTLCYCWVIERTDGVVMGFTDHDVDVTVQGVECSSTTGIVTTRLAQSLGLAADDLEIEGAIDDDLITTDDLRGGKYDNARASIYVVNWQNPLQFEKLAYGLFGTVFDTDTGSFQTEFRSLKYILEQAEGRSYQRTCDAKLGDSRCGVNLNNPAFTKQATVVNVSGLSITVNTLDGVPNDWFALGKMITVDGYEVGIRGQTNRTLGLWQRLPKAPDIGSTVTVIAGCKQDRDTCASKFNNILRFQGFPFIPGNDRLTTYPIRGQGDYTGGSLFK